MTERAIVDARGMPCPRPVIELAKAVRDLESGTEVAVLSDDPAARLDVPAWARMTGNTFVGVESPDDGEGDALVVRLS